MDDYKHSTAEAKAEAEHWKQLYVGEVYKKRYLEIRNHYLDGVEVNLIKIDLMTAGFFILGMVAGLFLSVVIR